MSRKEGIEELLPKRYQINNDDNVISCGPQAKDPNKYQSKLLKDLEAFLQACKNVIQLEKKWFLTDIQEIYWAVTFLDDKSAEV